MAWSRGVAVPKPAPRVRQRLAHTREREANLRTARTAVWQRDQSQCRCCHRRLSRSSPDMTRRGEVHHIVPRSRLAKGAHADTRNLVLLCVGCHADAQAYRIAIRGNANGTLRFDTTEDR